MLKRTFNFSILAVQIILTLVLLVLIYMTFALFDYVGGMPNLIGLILFQPLMAIAISAVTIFVCWLIGLPIRINKKLNNWWKKHFYISIFIGITGIIFIALSITPMFIHEIIYQHGEMELSENIPHQVLAVFGWLIIAFGTLHTFPPLVIEQWITKETDQ